MSPPMNIPNMPNLPAGQETMKFEQKKMTSASKTKVRYVEWLCPITLSYYFSVITDIIFISDVLIV